MGFSLFRTANRTSVWLTSPPFCFSHLSFRINICAIAHQLAEFLLHLRHLREGVGRLTTATQIRKRSRQKALLRALATRMRRNSARVRAKSLRPEHVLRARFGGLAGDRWPTNPRRSGDEASVVTGGARCRRRRRRSKSECPVAFTGNQRVRASFRYELPELRWLRTHLGEYGTREPQKEQPPPEELASRERRLCPSSRTV